MVKDRAKYNREYYKAHKEQRTKYFKKYRAENKAYINKQQRVRNGKMLDMRKKQTSEYKQQKLLKDIQDKFPFHKLDMKYGDNGNRLVIRFNNSIVGSYSELSYSSRDRRDIENNIESYLVAFKGK